MRNKPSLYAIGLALTLLLPEQTIAQDKLGREVDSLKILLSALPDDTNKVNVLSRLSYLYFNVNIKEGLLRGDDALALAEKLHWERGIARAYSSIGTNYWASGDYVKAVEYYLKCLEIDERLGEETAIAKSVHRVGVGYSTLQDKSKGIYYFKDALRRYIELGDSAAAMGCHLNIGQLYDDQNDTTKSLWHFHEAMGIAKRSGNKRDYAYILNLIGRSYAQRKEFKKAFAYENLSLRLFESLGKSNELAIQLGNFGDVYFMSGDYNNSIKLYRQAIDIFEPAIGRGEIAQYGYWFGKIGDIQLLTYKHQKSTNLELLDNAIFNLKEGLAICDSVTSWVYSFDFNNALAEAYSLKENYAEAFKHSQMANAYKDSINKTQKNEKMLNLELEYIFNKKRDSLNYQNRLDRIKLQNEKKIQRLYGIFLISVICLISLFFILRYRTQQLKLKTELNREKTQKQLREAEYQRRINEITFAALRSQMNPHFIFNALNTIQSFVYSNDKVSASSYLGKFSDLIRKILDNSSKEKISLAEEILILQLYIDIEKARFGNSFHAVIETDPELDSENIFIAPMLIQPYAENAIKHGLLHLAGEKKLMISIHITHDKQYVQFIIDDNGIGRERSREINKNRQGHYSFANSANERRIDLIHQIHGRKTGIEIIDKKDNDGSAAGTTVIISLPVTAETFV